MVLGVPGPHLAVLVAGLEVRRLELGPWTHKSVSQPFKLIPQPTLTVFGIVGKEACYMDMLT